MTTNLDRALHEAASLSKYEIEVIEGHEIKLFPQVRNSTLRKFFQLIGLIGAHIDLGLKVRRFKLKDAIIIRGFCTEFAWLTYIFSIGHTQNVYLLIHHNIQQAANHYWASILLRLLHQLQYRFIVNETCHVLQALGYSEVEIDRHLALLHPVVAISSITTAAARSRKKVGIIGQVRPGKQSAETLQFLLPLQAKLDFTLVVGTDDFSRFADVDWQGAELVNTMSHQDYLAALALCDIVVLNYEQDRYFYRCSGVIADAIGTQTIVVCPDFPMLQHQVMYPTQVGILYDPGSDLAVAVSHALTLSRQMDAKLFAAHYLERSAASMVPPLEQAIQLHASDLCLNAE
jgi:hypothetical protein